LEKEAFVELSFRSGQSKKKLTLLKV